MHGSLGEMPPANGWHQRHLSRRAVFLLRDQPPDAPNHIVTLIGASTAMNVLTQGDVIVIEQAVRRRLR